MKYLSFKRCDQVGMRLFRESAEAIVPLRCIKQKGDRDALIEHVHDRFQQHGIGEVC